MAKHKKYAHDPVEQQEAKTNALVKWRAAYGMRPEPVALPQLNGSAAAEGGKEMNAKQRRVAKRKAEEIVEELRVYCAIGGMELLNQKKEEMLLKNNMSRAEWAVVNSWAQSTSWYRSAQHDYNVAQWRDFTAVSVSKFVEFSWDTSAWDT